jgi:hypothetical protein
VAVYKKAKPKKRRMASSKPGFNTGGAGGTKRSLATANPDFPLENDGQELKMHWEGINPGTDFDKTMRDLIFTENPETGTPGYQDQLQQYTKSFGDWAAQNVRKLNTAVQMTLMDSNNPIFQKVFPIEYTNAAIFLKKTVRFNRDFADISTRKTGTRNISSSVSMIQGTMQFTAQAIRLDWYYMQTPDGLPFFKLMLDALYSNIWAYVVLTAAYEFRQTTSYYRRPEQLFPGMDVPMTPDALMDAEMEYFGLVSKEPQGFTKIVNRSSSIMEQMGGTCKRVLWSSADLDWITTKDETMTSREFSGYEGVANRNRTGTETITRYGDVEIIKLPLIGGNLHGELDNSIFQTPVQHGAMWRFLFAYEDVRPEDYTTDMSSIWACSWQTNDWDEYTVLNTLRNDPHFIPLASDLRRMMLSGRNELTAHPDEGQIYRQYLIEIIDQKIMAGGADHYYHKTTKTHYDNSPWKLDMLIKHNEYARDHNKKSTSGNNDPQVHFYVINELGELDERHTPTKFIEYMAEAASERIFGKLTALQRQHYVDGLALMDELTVDAPPDVNNELQKIIEQNITRVNEFGGPTNQYYDGNIAKLSDLYGYGTVPGLLTIANKIQSNDVAVLAVMSRAKEFVIVWELIVSRLLHMSHNHAALSDKLLPAENRHKDMSPIHKSMIVASFILCGKPYIPYTFDHNGNTIKTQLVFKDTTDIVNDVPTSFAATIFGTLGTPIGRKDAKDHTNNIRHRGNRSKTDIDKVENGQFRKHSFDNTIDKLKGSTPDMNFLVQSLAYPLTGHPDATEISDFDRRWQYSHITGPFKGLAMRFLLMFDLTLQNMARLAENNIPLPFFPAIVSPWQEQYMSSFPSLTGGRVGTTYMHKTAFDTIISFDHDSKSLNNETTLSHKVMIEDIAAFYINEYVKGGAIIGGSGKHFVNEGVAHYDSSAWKNLVTSVLARGKRCGHYSNMSILQSFSSAADARARKRIDVRGEFKRMDFAHRLPDSVVFPDRHPEPMFEGQFVLNEIYKFPTADLHDAVRLGPDQLSFQNTSMLRRTNFVCSQTSQLCYSKMSPDGKKLIQSKHLWKERFPGLVQREQSTATIKLGDHFKGNQLKYFQ